MALIVTSPRCHQFEQVLVAKHQAAVVHLQVSLEAGGEPEVDVAQPVRPRRSYLWRERATVIAAAPA